MRIIMNKNFKLLTAFFIIALTLATPQLLHATYGNLDDLPVELKSIIITRAATDQCSDGEGPLNLALVCKSWRAIVQEDVNKQGDIWKAWYGVPNHEEIYRTFLNGKLIYRPIPGSDDGIVTLSISKLMNPFKSTFDLSALGGTDKFLVITTNISDFFAPHPDQVVIGFFPHFRVKRIVASTPDHPFKDIMEKWDGVAAPVGIFWRWGSYDLTWYDYLTQSSLADISSRHLLENWLQAWADRIVMLPAHPSHIITNHRPSAITTAHRHSLGMHKYISCLFLN